MTTTHISQQFIDNLAQRLDQKYQDTIISTNYAWWMLEAITQQTKTQLLLEQTALSPTQQQLVDQWIHQQVHDHIPLQYLIGTVPFGDCTIHVVPPILIPRPETEQWCLSLIEKLQKCAHQPLRILDIGTGSGCIAIALARALPHATIWATDISSQALALAQKNALHNNVKNIRFILSDLFEQLPHDIRFDLIVSNPPYIGEREMLDPSVCAWEDAQALFASEDGIGILKKIITHARTYIQPNPLLYAHHIPHVILEIGYTQGAMVSSLFQNAHFHNVRIEKDLQGHDRIVAGYIQHEVHTIT